MNALKTAVSALVVTVSMNVLAQSSSSTVADGTPSLTRAEVMADLRVWRQAGMDEFWYREASDPVPARYEAALARYQALRSSPAYAQLVKTLRPQGKTHIAGR